MDQNKRVALLTAIDLGNLTRAAEQLGYTQSGLSYVIKALEAELGFPLLVRSRAGVRPHGRVPAHFAAPAGAGPEEPPARAGGSRHPRAGRRQRFHRHLPLHLPVLAAPDLTGFRPALPPHHRLHPGERPGGADEWLREGAIDLAFCSYHDSPYHWIPFLEDEIWAAVPARPFLGRLR